jgi:hypothetical protein
MTRRARTGSRRSIGLLPSPATPGRTRQAFGLEFSTSVDLYNLGEDPYEGNNLAPAHPDKVAAMQERLNLLGMPPNRWR